MMVLSYPFEKRFLHALETIKEYYPGFNESHEKSIRDAFLYGKVFFEGRTRASGEPYFSHALETLIILLQLRPDLDTILSCLLYNTIRDPKATTAPIQKKFGKKVALLCEAMRNMSKLKLLKSKQSERQYENIQRLFVVVSQDIRVIFVKLAARIHNLRTLQFIEPKKAFQAAREAQEIFAPVAEKLGLFEFKTEMEDLCLRHLQPEIYESLVREIRLSAKEQKQTVERAKKEIIRVLKKAKINCTEIQGRQKNMASVYEKMKRKNISSPRDINDLFGIRIVVPSIEDCYRVLGVLHSIWRPLQDRFKDYIAIPKQNGYCSLHTTLLGLAKSTIPTEIQIRTEQMHADAEWGPAAHWAYKKIKHSNFDQDYIQRMSWLPSSIHKGDEETRQQYFEELTSNIFTDRIYVFTPKGDIETLPVGSTPVDFAYAIHSDIGNSCIGAQVNGVIKPLNYKLQNEEIVEILTKKGRIPNPAWLDFVQSGTVKAHIKEALKKRKIPIFSKRIPSQSPKKSKPISKKHSLPSPETRMEVVIGGSSHVPYKIPDCCEAHFGQDVVAYKTRGLCFTLHNAKCTELNKLEPERFLEAYFSQERIIEITAFDRVGILRDFAITAANNGINISEEFDVHYSFDEKQRKIATLKIIVAIRSNNEVEVLLKEVLRIPDMISAKQWTQPKKSKR